jgi:serine/threonine protein kinase
VAELGSDLGVLAGRYRLLDLIGRGGMGVVYRARHDGLHKSVAIKVLRDELISDRQAAARFHQEAVAAANIGHPGIVNVTDFGLTDDGRAFLVMELLEGRDLSALLAERGALEPGHAIALTRKVLAPLAAAHARGIVHRDLKTQNVFVYEDEEQGEQVKLLDFGISKIIGDAIDSETGLTTQGAILGTPKYLAPEQAQGEKVDARSDIYALGIVLYEMLTGSVPFSGESPLIVLYAHVQKKPEPPRRRRPDLPISKGLEAVVLRALAKDPAERYQSAAELDAALAEVDPNTQRLPPVASAGEERPKGWRLVVGALGLALVVGICAYIVTRPARKVTRPATAIGAGASLSADAGAADVSPTKASPDLAVGRDAAAAPASDAVAPKRDQRPVAKPTKATKKTTKATKATKATKKTTKATKKKKKTEGQPRKVRDSVTGPNPYQ